MPLSKWQWCRIFIWVVPRFSVGTNQIPRRRAYHSSVVFGGWLYIDGGEISFEEGLRAPEQDTLGIDLSIDWTNATLKLTSIPRPSTALSLIQQSLWPDEQHNRIFCFGGEKSWANEEINNLLTPSESIWQFVPDGHGKGTWSEALGSSSTIPFPPGIIRSAGGGSANDNENAYYLGGFATIGTSPEIESDQISVPGLLTFNYDSLKLTNSSNDGGYFASRYAINAWPPAGVMLDVPQFGIDGILVLLGGGQGPFDNITIYDKHEQKWYSQKTTGSFSLKRDYFCAVGVQSEDGSTYEIFVHGGIIDWWKPDRNAPSDQIWILSLPSFYWIQASYTPIAARSGHTCHAVRNQLILIGGLDPSQEGSIPGAWWNGSADPWPQGAGVFDMNKLSWKDFYEANADVYSTPQAFKDYFSTGTKYPPSWSSDGVQRVFQPTNSAQTGRSSSHLDRKAAIGIGLTCGTLLSATAIIWKAQSWRRKKIQKLSMPPNVQRTELSPPTPELHGTHRHYELPGLESYNVEMFVPHRTLEMSSGRLAWELPAEQQLVELPPRRLIQAWREWLRSRNPMTSHRSS